MKLIPFFICLLLVITSVLPAQPGPAVPIATLQANAVTSRIASADFTNDGLPDLLVSADAYPNDFCNLYTQISGGQFTQQLIANTTLRQIVSFDTGDIDNNGWTDFALVSGTGTNTVLYWYENNNASFTPHLIDTVLEATDQILLRDFDNDGMLDVLAQEHNEITLRYGNSGGNFGTRHTIHSGTEFYAIDVADYNHDGLKDVSVASGGFEILINTGVNGQFNLSGSFGSSLCFGLKSGDLDHDGDVDIAAYFTIRGILAYENNGSGSFSFKDTIVKSSDSFNQYGIRDLDCDGDSDLYTSIGQSGNIVRVLNAGNCDFGSSQLIYHVQGLCYVTASADVDINGVPDLISGTQQVQVSYNQCMALQVQESGASAKIRMYPNPSSGSITLDNAGNEEMQFSLVDAFGKIINTFVVPAHSNSVYETLSPGFYLLKATNTSGELLFCEKLIVQALN